MIASCFISAGNAMIRYGFDYSSNAWMEIQWYLFAACVMLGAAQVLRVNEHVRVDVLYGRYPVRAKVWVDLLGLAFFVLPVVLHDALVLDAAAAAHGRVAGGLGQRRRADPLAGDGAAAARLRAARGAGASARSSSASPGSPARPNSPCTTSGRCNDDAAVRAGDVRRPRARAADRLSGRLLARRARPAVRAGRHHRGLVPGRLPGQPAAQRFRHPVERAAAGDPLLHADGGGAREVRPGRGHARLDGPAVRPGARRARLLGDHRRLHPRRHHRHGGGPGDRDGDDRAAGDDALPLRHALRLRRARRLGHHHPAGAALAGAGGAGRPARPLGRRHVQGRLGTVDPAGAAVRHLHLRAVAAAASPRARRAARGAHASRPRRCGTSRCAASCRRRC